MLAFSTPVALVSHHGLQVFVRSTFHTDPAHTQSDTPSNRTLITRRSRNLRYNNYHHSYPPYHVTSSSNRAPSPPPSPQSSNSSSSTTLPSSTATYVDPRSGSTVHVIGCVHGSSVSAGDVESVLSNTNPDMIVLELCESRLSSLRKSVLKTPSNKRLSLHLNANKSKNRKSRSFRQIAQTFNGVPQAILALLLDGAYRLQVISGLDPGIEFALPIRSYPPHKLVCGDASAQDTVNRLYHVFISPLKSIRVSISVLIAMIKRILVPPQGGVNLLKVLFLEPGRLFELIRLLIAASMVGLGLYLIGSATAAAIEMTPLLTLADTGGVGINSTGAVGGIGSNIIMTILNKSFGFNDTSLSTRLLIDTCLEWIFTSYCIVSSLHFLKVLIIDRDAVIAENIARVVETQEQKNCKQPVKICAVVGLLHVNGVVQALHDRT